MNGHGGARPGSGYPRTPIDTARARSLRQQGVTFAEIGRRFGVSAWVIRNALGQIQRK